jgi:GT2 family glycosyltransferase
VKVSVIIPAHNGGRFLARCLGALVAQEGVAFETIVVDNGSSDGGADLVAAEFPQVRLVREERALGFGGACNRGLRLARDGGADVLVVLNQDTEVDPGWLAALAAAMEADPRLGVAGSLARFPSGRVQHAGGELLTPLGYGRNLGHGQPADTPLPATPPDFMSGVALAMRREMLEEIGLFDEGFNPAYFEDVDLCLRARAAGWQLRLVPEATLVHREGAASAGADYTHAALIERNRLRLRLKHAPLAELLDRFFPAEHAHLRERARGGTAHVLRRAYLDALLMLPPLGRPAAENAAIRAALVELRRKAAAYERDGVRERGGRGVEEGKRGGVEEAALRRREVPAHSSAPLLPYSSTPNEPPVAIIMLTWNGLHYTRECLESLRELTEGVEYKVIVVDNGSTDGTREYLRSLGWVELIENAENRGYVRGNNQGIAAAPAGWDVVLLNNDMRIIQGDWLRRLREVAHQDPAHGMVGCRLLMSDGRLLHAGTYMPTDSFWGWQIGGGEEDVGQYHRVREVDGIVGACMYLRRDVIDAVGVLDERFFSYYEDTDYCLRVQQAGYSVVVAGDVSLIHHENVSTRLNKVDFWGMYGTSQATFLEKWEHHYRNRYRHRVFWHSLVSAPTGYATSSKQLLISLDRQGVDARLAYLYGTDFSEKPSGDPRVEQMRHRPKDTSLVQVVYNQCDAFHKNSGSYRIGFSMLEVTGIPDDWVAQCNLMDEVWVPSQFNVETFRNSGVTRPLHVIPLGVDPDYFHPAIKARRFSDKFTFLSVFEWGERKAPEVLIRAFCAAFTDRDDVVLVLKTDNRDGDVNVAQQIASMGLPRNAPRIVLLYNQELPGYQLGSLYRAADCFVTATRGEGWGMPILEAMACGLPTITTNWSAQTEFVREDLCFPVRVKRLIPAIAKCPYYVGYEWADPDFDHLVHRMRYVYDEREAAREVGRRAAEAVARDWTWDRAAEKIIARLEAVGA